MKLHRTFLALVAGLAAPLCLAQTHNDLLDTRTRDLLHEALSGENAKEHVIQITRFNRVQASRGYRSAAQYVLQQLRSFGFSEKDAYIESFPSNGKIEYQTWQSPSGWDISSAELRMVEPRDERIIGYPEIGMSLITCSNPGDVTAELIWVGEGTKDEDYAGKDVKGKFVLATGYGGDVHRQAVIKRGAKAVVCYLDDARSLQHPDMLRYTGMWPKADELSRVTFGFNLSRKQGERLRNLLTSGTRVVLHGVVKGTGLEPFYMDIVVAHIRGSDPEGKELVLSAHLDHPKESANDNASGSGAILDMARAMRELIQSGRLGRPRHSIRFLWVPEWNGTQAYVDKHPELAGPPLGGKFLANVNMDMVGENLELLHSQLVITRTPDSAPSVLDDVVENMTFMMDQMGIASPRGSASVPNFRIVPYGGGSDHMMFIDRKVPGVMLVHSDFTHHSSYDTPDKVDPLELRRCQVIGASTVWFLASLDEGRSQDLLGLVTQNALARLAADARTARRLLSGESAATRDSLRHEAANVLIQASRRERERIGTLLTFYNSPVMEGRVKSAQRLLEDVYQRLASDLPRAETIRRQTSPDHLLIPVRLTRGPLDFGLPQSKLPEADQAWYRSKEFVLGSDERFELVNFIDGRRTVGEIRDMLSAEFGPVPMSVVSRYIDDLVKAGVIRWGRLPVPQGSRTAE